MTGHRGQLPDDIADLMSRVARTLQAEQDVGTTLQAVVEVSVGTVPGVQYAGVTIIEDRHRLRTEASTGDFPRKMDQLQHDAAEGPCLTSASHHGTVRMNDIDSERRWPEFVRRAREAGLGSALSLQLYVQGDSLGALNLYSTRRGAMNAESEHVASLLAAHAAVALAAVRRESELRQALETRDTIGMAKGIVMERYGVDPDAAFRVLVRLSQETNTKLREVARQVVDTRSGT
jgi:GAF domain-containing protein